MPSLLLPPVLSELWCLQGSNWLPVLCCLQVVLHVESWNITALQALLQVFTPGGRRRREGG